MKRARQPSIEQFEPRTLQTLVFVFNGNAYADAKPNDLTQSTAVLLNAHGDRAVQLDTPRMSTPGAFYELADQIRSISKGRPIGLIGFSAGGTLALRLAGLSSLNVQAAAAYYGPPDLGDYLHFHMGDRFYRVVAANVEFNQGVIKLLSGPSSTDAYVIDAFGLRDHNVVPTLSAVGFHRDFPDGRVYFYPGPHGVGATADPAALKDYLAHL
jgi:Dienelactone hydrolase family